MFWEEFRNTIEAVLLAPWSVYPLESVCPVRLYWGSKRCVLPNCASIEWQSKTPPCLISLGAGAIPWRSNMHSSVLESRVVAHTDIGIDTIRVQQGKGSLSSFITQCTYVSAVSWFLPGEVDFQNREDVLSYGLGRISLYKPPAEKLIFYSRLADKRTA